MTSCKSDQLCDYLHVESSFRQGTPCNLGDGLISSLKPNYHTSKVKVNSRTQPGYGTATVRKKDYDCTSVNFGDKLHQGSEFLTKLDPVNSSLQSEVETLSSMPGQNDLSFVQLYHQHGLEMQQPYQNSQGIVDYLKNLLFKNEAIQSTLHCKVKDSYKIIQNQTQQLLKNEADIKSLRNELQTYKHLSEQFQTNERILRMKNKQLVAVNEKNLLEQDLLQKRISGLQKDVQSIWNLHCAFQAENTEKQIIVEKTLSRDLQAIEHERRALMQENELTSKKAAVFEKHAEDANLKLITLEKENQRLSDEKQQVAEEKEAVVAAQEQLKVELTICQTLCEKLIAEKAQLLQRTIKPKSKSRYTTNEEPDKNVTDYDNENVAIDELREALCALPFVKDKTGGAKSVDVVSEIKEHVETLEKQIIVDKDEFEKSWKLLKDNNDLLKNQNIVLQFEKAKSETERDKSDHARRQLQEKFEESKKEQAELEGKQSEIRLSVEKIELAKTNLEKVLEEKDYEINLQKTDSQEQLMERDRTISLLQEKLKASDFKIEKRSHGTQTSCVFEERKTQRRHSEGSIQGCSVRVKYSNPQVPEDVLRTKKLNLLLQKKLEASEKERLTSQKELEEVIQHFKDAFDDQIAKELDKERRNNEERERELLSKLEKQRKECADRKEHSTFVSKAYQTLQGELENLWHEKEEMNRKCESLEYERNQLREQVEELCRNHSDDVNRVEGSTAIGKKKTPSTSKQSPLPRRTKVS